MVLTPHKTEELIGRGLSSVVLAAGEATRMRPLSLGSSKAMLPFLGRPLLEYLFDDLLNAGLDRVLLNSRGRDGDIEHHFGAHRNGMNVEYLSPTPWAGTAGRIISMLEESPDALSSPFLVIYGDSLLRMDYGALVRMHRASGAAMTIACHRPRFGAFLLEDEVSGPDRPRTNFGVADLRPDGRVIGFKEKPYLAEIPGLFAHPVANAAVYVIEPHILGKAAALQSRPLDFGHHVIPWIIEHETVVGFDIAPGFRLDLGTLPHYLSIQLAALMGEVPVPIDGSSPRPGVWLQEGASIHPKATVVPPVFVGAGVRIDADATVECSVLGRDSIVAEGARISHSVLLEHVSIGARATVEEGIVAMQSFVAPDAALPPGTVTGPWSRIGGPGLILPRSVLRDLLGEPSPDANNPPRA